MALLLALTALVASLERDAAALASAALAGGPRRGRVPYPLMWLSLTLGSVVDTLPFRPLGLREPRLAAA